MKISIVVPCYNEEKDIKEKSAILLNKLKEIGGDFEVLLVNDGSKDNTKNVIKEIEGIVPVSYEPNRGKGGAVQEGIKHATGDYVLFMDADLSTDLEAINKVIPLTGKVPFIIGSRHHKESIIPIKQPFMRRFIGTCCRIIVNILCCTHYSDTQCGFKAIRTDIAKIMAEKQIITNFAFDVEYLYIAKLNKIAVQEIPIIWRDDRGSTVSPIKSSIKFFKDLFKVKINKKNYYL